MPRTSKGWYLGTQNEDLPILTADTDRAFTTGAFQDGGKVLPGFGVGIHLHDETSAISTPTDLAARLRPWSRVSRAQLWA